MDMELPLYQSTDYIGFTYLYHQASKQFVLNWIGETKLDQNIKLKIQKYLSTIFHGEPFYNCLTHSSSYSSVEPQ